MEEWRRKKIENVYAKWERKTANQDKDSSDQNGHVRSAVIGRFEWS